MAGLKINVTYEASAAALQNSNPALYAQFTNAVQTAVNYFQSVIATPITVNISFGWGTVGGSPVGDGLGASSTYQYTTNYTQLLIQAKAALTTSPVQLAALASLPASDPTGGAVFSIATAEAAALGFDTTGATIGGSAGLSSSVNWAWTQNNIPAGASDAIGTLEHEISEVLGRSDTGGKAGQYTFLDMFRYTAANGQSTNAIGAQSGARDQPFVNGYNVNAPSYFSYNGTTNTLLYETPANVAGGADVADWAPSVPSDSFGDASTNATPDLVSPTDLAAMNVLGYTLAGQALPANFTGAGTSGVLMVTPRTGQLVVAQTRSVPTETYTQIGGLGPEWDFPSFAEPGDYLGDGNDGFLIQNLNSYLVVVGEDVDGTAQYTQIGGFGGEWTIVATGQFTSGTTTEQLMLRDFVTGVLVVGAVANNTLQYTQVGGIGDEWSVVGAGDYSGDGQTSILMRDTQVGSLVLGEDVNNTMQYTQIGGLGSEWTINGSGDLLGTGQDDFLMRNINSGALVVGDVSGGSAQYTQVGNVGSEWSFLGIGDYDGASNAEFLMENKNNGVLVVGTILNGVASYEQIGQVNPTGWSFVPDQTTTVA